MDKENINIIMKQLNIDEENAIKLLESNSYNIVDAISNYIEPNNNENNKQNHYNITYDTCNDNINKITELRTIVTDKENVFKK